MKILIITKSFAPDSDIGSKRPSYFAKYLMEYGHDVSVIRSGIITTKPDKELADDIRNCHIYSYEGDNSDADRYDRGEYIQKTKNERIIQRKKDTMIKKCARTLYYNIKGIFSFYFRNGRRIRRMILNTYNKSPELKGFDVVLSVYGFIGCIQAGKIISQKEKCGWIVDFKDLMDRSNYPLLLRTINSFAQKSYLRQADCCLCVSEGNTTRLAASYRGKFASKVFCINNGYIKQTQIIAPDRINDKLRICYTGSLYRGKSDCGPLYRALKSSNISAEMVIIDYAGKDSEIMLKQAKEYGYEGSIIDHHIISRTETARIQAASDLFLVLSWNNKRDQGILTGKFYEALQHRKPVLALVSGDVPNSELKMLIDNYHLGFCYEETDEPNSIVALSTFLREQYQRKMAGTPIEYDPDEKVFSRFEYGNIVRELEKRMNEVKKGNGKKQDWN